jgi:hypothetical protein
MLLKWTWCWHGYARMPKTTPLSPKRGPFPRPEYNNRGVSASPLQGSRGQLTVMPPYHGPTFPFPLYNRKSYSRASRLGISSPYLPWLSSAMHYRVRRGPPSTALVLDACMLGLSYCTLRCAERYTSGLADARTQFGSIAASRFVFRLCLLLPLVNNHMRSLPM